VKGCGKLREGLAVFLVARDPEIPGTEPVSVYSFPEIGVALSIQSLARPFIAITVKAVTLGAAGDYDPVGEIT
jgi:hypothetical protein